MTWFRKMHQDRSRPTVHTGFAPFLCVYSKNEQQTASERTQKKTQQKEHQIKNQANSSQHEEQEQECLQNQAQKFLENSFPRLSCAAIKVVFEHGAFSFPEAFRILSQIEASCDPSSFPEFPVGLKIFLKNNRTSKALYVRDQKLKQEIASIPDLNKKERASVESNNVPEEVKDEEKEDKENEEDCECGCSYGDFHPDEMVECISKSNHKVCKALRFAICQ